MDERDARQVAEELWRALQAGDWETAGGCLHDDFVQEWPQSGERIIGRDNATAIEQNFPGGLPTMRFRRTLAGGDLAVLEVELTYADGSRYLGASKADDSIATRQRAHAAFRDARDDRAAARAAARLFHEHFYRGEGAVAVGWLRRGFRHLEQDPDCVEAGWLRMAEAELHLHQGPVEQAVDGAARAVQTARDHPYSQGLCRIYRGEVLALRGAWDEAEAEMRRAHQQLLSHKPQGLIQLAGVGPGDTVLDVAAGYGEPGLSAARSVAPGGQVVCADISAEMLAVGRERAAAARRRNPGSLRARRRRPTGGTRCGGRLHQRGDRDLTAVYQLGSPELATRWLRSVAPPITSLVDGRPPEVQEHVWTKVTQAWAPYATADGRVRLENQAVWVTGTK
jgi:SnoaL-like domain/ubiE/COQ5 methyltransferase family